MSVVELFYLFSHLLLSALIVKEERPLEETYLMLRRTETIKTETPIRLFFLLALCLLSPSLPLYFSFSLISQCVCLSVYERFCRCVLRLCVVVCLWTFLRTRTCVLCVDRDERDVPR